MRVAMAVVALAACSLRAADRCRAAALNKRFEMARGVPALNPVNYRFLR